jgi:hypothetical protein
VKLIAQLAAIILMFAIVPTLSAKHKQTIEHAPLPTKVLTAKAIFIQNDSGRADIADEAYTVLKAWGRFQVVDHKDKADLLLVLSTTSTQREGTRANWASLYNSTTGAWTSGTVQSPTTDTLNFTQAKLIDAETRDTAWTDQKPWLRKHPATIELIKALRHRIEEQEER